VSAVENRGQGRNILELTRPNDISTLTPIFERAGERARAQELPYAGVVTPAEAWRLHTAGVARIVDVRTRPEHEYVGRVPGAPLVEWRRYGDSHPNPNFLRELAGHVSPDEPILFLCRSGVRSHHAAELARNSGYPRAFNIQEGFEGDLDDASRRGSTGWRAAGLPWEQD